tara:strand:+ start:658 stop:2454 length:1797 start_codon:yes stop_codon:yes gene_type:complete
MATFEEQIEAVCAFGDIPLYNITQAELTQFLRDGVMDVTNRVISLRPQEAESFSRLSAEQTSDGFNPGTSKILAVLRESGTNNQWEPCRKISPELQYKVTDTESLEYASKFNPAYMVSQNNTVHVFPTPGGNPNAYKVLYVNNVPTDVAGSSALEYNDSDIKYFPDDKVHLVVIYASMKTLLAYIGNIDTELPDDITLPSIPIAPALEASSISFSETTSYVGPALSIPTFPTVTWTFPSIPVAPSLSAASVTISGTAPTYISPVLSVTSFPSLTWTMPDSPIPPVLSGNSISTLGDVPSYTKPATVLDIPKVDTFLDDEDPEMADSARGKVISQIQMYQADIQNELNEFNMMNAKYQANLQKDIQNAQLGSKDDDQALQKYSGEVQDYQAEVASIVQGNQAQISEWQQENAVKIQKYTADMQDALNNFNKENTEYQAKLQKDIQNAQLVDANESKKLQKYQAEVQGYSAEVGKIVQGNQAEVNEWQIESALLLQKYTAEMQSSLNDFNKSQVEYQGELQRVMQEAQLKSADDNQKLQKYATEIQSYSSEVQSLLSDYNAKIQKLNGKYQWAQGRYVALKQEYNEAFGLLAPKQENQRR